jgi:hypothetical protein
MAAAQTASMLTHTHTAPADTDTRELATRHNDGIDVRLFWRPADDAVLLQVDDVKLGVRFDLAVPRDEALNAFAHPFAYVDASCRRSGLATSRYDTPATAMSASTSGAAHT